MSTQKTNWRLSATKRLSSSTTSCMMYHRPPPHVLAMVRSKSASNSVSGSKSTLSSLNGSKSTLNSNHSANTVEAELRRRKERREEKEKIAKMKREYKNELSKSKRTKYSTASLSAGGVLRELKNTASRGLETVKHSVENLLSQVRRPFLKIWL